MYNLACRLVSPTDRNCGSVPGPIWGGHRIHPTPKHWQWLGYRFTNRDRKGKWREDDGKNSVNEREYAAKAPQTGDGNGSSFVTHVTHGYYIISSYAWD